VRGAISNGRPYRDNYRELARCKTSKCPTPRDPAYLFVAYGPSLPNILERLYTTRG